MEREIPELGGSLAVPWIQQLAKQPLKEVPTRYVRRHPQDALPNVTFDKPSSLPCVPVIDMQRLFSQEFIDIELNRFHHACKDWGFFQLINHGISSSLVEKVKVATEEFFNLPMEEKKKYWQRPGDPEGFGQAFVVSEEQKLNWGDMFYMVTLPKHLRKPHLFPKLPLPFRDAMEDYSQEMKNLALKILKLVRKALEIDPENLKELFEEGYQKMRMNYYAPCPQPELVLGLNSHSDAGGLTILLQVNDVEGLQIKKDGMWVPIKPLPDAFIVNIGDILEIVSNGNYRSVEHRATVNSEKERMSIATFYSPKLDGDLGPAPSLITPKSPALFRTISVVDYFKGLFSRELDGKSYIDVMKIENDQQGKPN